jgi:hypothetical protein
VISKSQIRTLSANFEIGDHNVKTTYLLNKTRSDGTSKLSVATYEEWISVVEANKSLPAEQQRYFIIDCITDGQDVDRMVIESTAAEYRKWNRERMAPARNRVLGRNYQLLSLDAPVRVGDTVLNLKEALASSVQVEDQACFPILEMQLRAALAAWKPWAVDMLDYYLRGERRSCTESLSAQYGVSPQVIRKYKRQFEEFTKNFLGGVSF